MPYRKIISGLRVPFVVLLVVGLLAAQVVHPLSRAGAQPLKQDDKGNQAPQLPRSAPGRTFTLSPAVFGFLTRGLGVQVGSSRSVPVPARGDVVLAAAGPSSLPLHLPKGVAAPTFTRTDITIDPESGALTAVAQAPGARLSLTIAHAQSPVLRPGDLTSHLEITVPILGTSVELNGVVGATGPLATVTLTGSLRSDTVLTPGPVTIDKGDSVSVTSARGLLISGPVTIGSGDETVHVTVAGKLASAADWSLAAYSAPKATVWSPLRGLHIMSHFQGSVSDVAGKVRFDVTTHGDSPIWHPVNGVSVFVHGARFADVAAPGSLVVPSGLAAGTPWIDVTGSADVPAGAGTLLGRGDIVVDTGSGRAALSFAQSGSLRLSGGPVPANLSNSGLAGQLLSSPGGLAGPIDGFGQVNVDTPGGGVNAHASLHLDRAGVLTAAFPFEPSLLDLGPVGTATTVRWASEPSAGLPAGLSASPTPPAVAHATSATTNNAAVELTAFVSTTTDPSQSFDISPAVQEFFSDLGISSGPALTGSLSGSTLTLNVGSPTSLPITLPAGVGALTFAPATVTIDESTGTLTLSATATDPNGATAILTVTIANASTTTLSSTDLDATIEIDNLPVLGTTVTLKGTLAYSSGAVTASLTGTLANPVTPIDGLTISSGATFTLDTTDGLTVSGTAVIGTSATFQVGIAGAIKDTANWSLTVTASSTAAWTPLPGLSVQPAFTGTVTDAAGAVTFDLGADQVATWAPPTGLGSGSDVAVSVTVGHVEISNGTPSSTLTCPDHSDGDIWVDVQGTLSFQADGTSSTVSSEGCVDVNQKTFSISSSAPISLPAVTGVSLNNAILTVSDDNEGKISLTAGANLTVTALPSQPTFGAGIAFGQDGDVVAAVGVVPGAQFGLQGNAALFVSTKEEKHFDPTTLGLGIAAVQPFDLKPGVSVLGAAAIPSAVQTELSDLKIPVASVQGEANLSAAGFSVSLAVEFGDTTNGIQFFTSDGAAVYLNSLSIAASAGASSVGFSASGEGYIQLPTLAGQQTPTGLDVTLTGSLTQDDTGALNLAFGFSLSAIAGDCGPGGCEWQNAFGIPGLQVGGLSASIGLDIEEDEPIPLPTLDFTVTNLVLPATWSTDLGIQSGTQFSLAANFDLNNPLLAFSITNPSGPALEPLQPFSTNPNVQDALVLNNATFVFAPAGAKDSSGKVWDPGYDLQVAATIAGVPVNVEARLDLTQLDFEINAQVGNLPLGNSGVTIPGPQLVVTANPTSGVSVQFDGSFSDSHSGINLAAQVHLSVSTSLSSLANAYVALTIQGGQPAYLAAGANLSGTFLLNSSGASLSASGNGYLYVAGTDVGSIAWSYSLTSGLFWQDVVDAANTVAHWFQSIPGWTDQQYTSALQSLKYGATQVAGALNSIGVSAAAIGQDIKTFFSVDYDGSLVYYLQQAGLTPTQIGSALQSAFADADSTVLYWLDVYGYTANQIATALKSVFADADSTVLYWLDEYGYSPTQIASALQSAFNDADSTVAYWLDVYGYSPTQIASALQSAFGDADSTVAYWLNNLGYNANQIGTALQGAYGDAEYQIIDTLSSIGVSSQSILSGLTSFFTGNGSYNISTSDPWNAWIPLYMDVSGGSQSPNTGVIQWPWDGGYNQDWYVVPTTNGYAELVNRNSGQCLSVGGNSYSAGQQLVQYPCYGWADQQWLIGGGVWPGGSVNNWTATIQSLSSGLFADVYGASGSQGTGIDQYYWNGNWNQSWHFTQAIG